MRGEPDLASVAALIGDPSRAAMLTALVDGRALPAGELAAAAGLSLSGASAHLARLVQGGLLAVQREGRYRYYQLAGPSVAAALESWRRSPSRLAGPVPVRRPLRRSGRGVRATTILRENSGGHGPRTGRARRHLAWRGQEVARDDLGREMARRPARHRYGPAPLGPAWCGLPLPELDRKAASRRRSSRGRAAPTLPRAGIGCASRSQRTGGQTLAIWCFLDA